MIRRVTKDDNLDKVAELIYDSDNTVFGKLFGAKAKAIGRINALMMLQNNTFSYKHILCILMARSAVY
jgi:hypothetical protein